MTTRLSRRTLLERLALATSGLLAIGLAGCTQTVLTAAPPNATVTSSDAPPGASLAAAPASTPTPGEAALESSQPPATTAPAPTTPLNPLTPGPAPTVAVP